MIRPGASESEPGAHRGSVERSSSPGPDGRTRASEPLADRLTRLARVTGELVGADTVEAVAKTVVTHGAEAVGAGSAALTLLGEDGQTVRMVALSGGLPGDEDDWGTFPVTAHTPASEAIRTGRRVVTRGAGSFAQRYPDLPMAARGVQTVVSLPLRSGPGVLGSITLLFTEPRELEATEDEFLDILADTCAQGLERITAQQSAAAQSAKLAFLAEAATELASSLDYEVTLTNVAKLAVPTFADWCAIDVVDDGRLRRVAVAHVDPAKVQLAQDLAERYPPDPDAPHGAWQVLRTGHSELIAEVTDEMLVAGAVDDEHLAIARAMQLCSAVTVPLVARGRVLGVITWVAAESDRRYNADDVALAEELANRAAVSIDNAELHSQTLAAAVALQRAVLPETLATPPGWEIAHHYSPSGRTEVGGDFYDVVDFDDGRIVMFVGDVMGRGVGAAAAMAQMRAAIRAYAAVDPSPEVVLTKLDRMFARYQSEQFVTVCYLLADPARDELLVGNAGHPPPLLLHRDGTCTQLPLADGAPLGVPATGPRQQSVVQFHAGDAVVAFTDGLIERRSEDITASQDRLALALETLTRANLAEALVELVSEVGDPSRDDDVAVVVARRI